MPEISVIVPVYKVEKFLGTCIESILRQSFADFELILVDDGSPDNCGQICDEYAAKDSRIRVIHQKNQGLSCARNTGIDAAKGRYICFVDSDDYVAPDYCKVLYQLLSESDADFSVCGVCRFPDGEDPIPVKGGETLRVSSGEFLEMQLERKSEFGVWNKMYRREIFEKIRFAPGRLNEDVIFSADLLKTCPRGAVVTGEELLFYRQREGSIVSSQSVKGSSDRVYAGAYLLEAVLEYCPALTDLTLKYAISYPWMFVDPIYVKRKFADNQTFLEEVQSYLRKYLHLYRGKAVFSKTVTGRMTLFAKSRLLYGFNAYTRLARVYLYRLVGKDAYADGHGI